MSHIKNEEWIEHQVGMRSAWLLDEGYKDSDVMEDDNGEYVISEVEAEDCSLRKNKVYLPVELTKEIINNY